jgi:hypothetical protein
MPITLTVNDIPFQYPIAGDSPGWGEGATDWATEVTLVLNDLIGANDIIENTFIIPAVQSSPSNVVGLLFNTGQVRSAIIEYSIYRTSTSNQFGFAESGSLSIVYDDLAPSGTKWAMTGYGIAGNSGVTFSILDTGQIQFTATSIGSPGYSGNMHFRARSLGK